MHTQKCLLNDFTRVVFIFDQTKRNRQGVPLMLANQSFKRAAVSGFCAPHEDIVVVGLWSRCDDQRRVAQGGRFLGFVMSGFGVGRQR
jgi:hypothetical protein